MTIPKEPHVRHAYVVALAREVFPGIVAAHESCADECCAGTRGCTDEDAAEWAFDAAEAFVAEAERRAPASKELEADAAPSGLAGLAAREAS